VNGKHALAQGTNPIHSFGCCFCLLPGVAVAVVCGEGGTFMHRTSLAKCVDCAATAKSQTKVNIDNNNDQFAYNGGRFVNENIHFFVVVFFCDFLVLFLAK